MGYLELLILRQGDARARRRDERGVEHPRLSISLCLTLNPGDYRQENYVRMAERVLKFDCLEDNYGGLLSPEDVHLFYYDIGIDSEMGNSFIYEWDDQIQKFVQDNNLVINVCDAASIPTTFSENKMFFTIGDNDKGNKAVAFFRHLRDAFAHYHIGTSGEYYCMKDFRGPEKTVTMNGKIHQLLLKGLLDVFFTQKSKEEDRVYRLSHPEI